MIDAVTIPFDAEQALLIIRQQFEESLVAIYLHGSAVAGGLRPYSDIDLLVVIDHPITTETSAQLVTELMKISGHPCGGNTLRPLELIIFLRADLTTSIYPARSEFVYGEWLRDAFQAGAVPKPVTDPELTLVLAQARLEAKPLIGPSATELLPVIPQADIRRAIGDILPALLDTLEGDERNVLPTLTRMWRTLTTGEFVSKDVAAEWAEKRLPVEQAAVLAGAREAYMGIRKDDWRTRQQEVRRAVSYLHDCVVAAL